MLFDFSQLLIVAGVYLLGAASPGPSNMRILGVALSQGRARAVSLAAGVVTGSLFWGVLAASGLSAFLVANPDAVSLLKLVGGVYLLYLAIKSLRSAYDSEEHGICRKKSVAAVSKRKLYRQGMMMHLVNPKALLGWVATMTLGIGAQPSPLMTISALGVCASLSVLVFFGYAIVFSWSPIVRFYFRVRRLIELALAGVYACAGFGLLVQK